MKLKKDVLAKKYALAFLNTYYETIGDKCFESLLALRDFFKKNKKILMYLNIPSIPEEKKSDALDQILNALKTCNTINILARTLFKQRRIGILNNIVNHIIAQYRIRKNILAFKIFSSHQLEEKEKQIILSFLEKSVNATVLADFFVDKKLLCGIKILGDTMMFERSFAKRLEEVKRSVLHRVRL